MLVFYHYDKTPERTNAKEKSCIDFWFQGFSSQSAGSIVFPPLARQKHMAEACRKLLPHGNQKQRVRENMLGTWGPDVVPRATSPGAIPFKYFPFPVFSPSHQCQQSMISPGTQSTDKVKAFMVLQFH